MELAMIGLGKMGANMARRLARAGHRVVGFNRSRDVTDELARSEGVIPAYSLSEAVQQLQAPRAVWVMVPSGDATESALFAAADLLAPGDILIDGGNSNYKDTQRRGKAIEARGIHFVDVGTSGGVWGLKEGYSLMIGGSVEAVERLRPIFASLAPGERVGWGRVGPCGAGHFTKMVHNGIEYGMMQAFAEGFDILRAKSEFSLDLAQIANIWQTGSVVRSWLLDLTAAALAENPGLEGIKGWVADSGEGRWTVFESVDLDVPAPVITLALQMRFISRQDENFAAKLLAAMRNQFGGHAIKSE